VLTCFEWYASEQTSEEIKGGKGWIRCCGLEIEADTGENADSRCCFTVKALSGKALSGSTTLEHAGLNWHATAALKGVKWFLCLQQLLEVHLPPANACRQEQRPR